MPRYQIEMNGQRFEVDAPDENSLSLAISKMQGQSEPAAQMQPDPRDNIAGKADAFMRGAADTLSFGLADEIAAQAQSGPLSVQKKPDSYYDKGIYAGAWNPLGMIARTLDAPWASETKSADYERALAEQRAIDKSDAANRFGYRLGGQLAGGVTGGVGLAKNGLSFATNAANAAKAAEVAAKAAGSAVKAGSGLGRVAAGSAADGLILGAAQGFGSGEGFEGRLYNAGLGGGTGAALGLAAPLAVAGASKVAKTAVAPLFARIYPESYAKDAIATALRRSGKTPDEIASSMSSAADDGQGMYNIADALGYTGQRLASTVARNPHNERQAFVKALETRQLDQGRRVAGILTDAAGTPWTPKRLGEVLSTRRAMEAEKNYGPVRMDTSAIDVSPAVDTANRLISPAADKIAKANNAVPTDLAARSGIEAGEAAIRDPIRQAVKEARSYLASDTNTVTNVEKAFRAKTNIDMMIGKATDNGQGALVEALIPVRNALDEALANTSKTYAQARDAYRVSSQNIDAIDLGRELARPRNRIDDNIATFQRLTPDQQATARVGYFDPAIVKAESNAGKMTNSARPFMSESARQELPVFAAPGERERLMRRLAREQQMSETTNAALGNSKTADNFADAADFNQFDPGVIAALVRRDTPGAVMAGATRMLNEAKGIPPSVVERIARALLETDSQAARKLLSAGTEKLSKSDALRARIAALLTNLGAAGAGRLGSP